MFNVKKSSIMKTNAPGASFAPQPSIEAQISETWHAISAHLSQNITRTSQSISAIFSKVRAVVHEARLAIAPEITIETEADRHYFHAVGWASAGIVFPPLLLVAALCVYKAKQSEKGGKR